MLEVWSISWPEFNFRLFFGRLTSKHAEKLLLDPDTQPDRNVLIRSSTTLMDQIVLSVRLPTGEVIHILTHRQVNLQVRFGAIFDFLNSFNSPRWNNFKPYQLHATEKPPPYPSSMNEFSML